MLQQTSKEEHDTHEPASWIAARGAARSTAGTLVCQPCSVFGSKFGLMMLPFCRVLSELILGPRKIVLGSSNKIPQSYTELIPQSYTEFQVLGCQAGLPVTPRRLASKGPAQGITQSTFDHPKWHDHTTGTWVSWACKNLWMIKSSKR